MIMRVDFIVIMIMMIIKMYWKLVFSRALG